ncbi:MAG TPA: chromate efflux transporter [Chthoniobacterales bacterium]|nr:chromate efflux transporter [Chthoniobacterales bacterium]
MQRDSSDWLPPPTAIADDQTERRTIRHPSFAEALRFWLKLGFIGFGGPAGQIAIMQTELVERRRWISQSRFLHALNFCMLLPGPEATQLAIYIGWLLHKTRGGIVAGALFVIPSIFVLWTLSFVYAAYGNMPWIVAIFSGLKPAVMAIVAVALIRIGRRALKNLVMWGIAALAFIGIFFFKIPFPAIILGAVIIGFLGEQVWPTQFVVKGIDDSESLLSDNAETPSHVKSSRFRTIRLSFVCLFVWLAPIFLVGLWLGPNHTLFNEGLFFSKAAIVTFGGAYAVLPYVAQQAVEKFGWLQPGQMIDGLALAETTPGPLIMVLQFVGFMGGWNQPGLLSPLLAGTLGGLITIWVTFVPSFFWILLGAPHIERLRGNTKLTAALSTVTAAVVGVILNLAVWFGLHAIFPEGQAINWFALILGIVLFVGISRWNWGVVPVVIGSGIAGWLYQFALR